MNLLPKVKKLDTKEGFLPVGCIAPFEGVVDSRIKKAIEKLPTGDDGVELIIITKGGDSEEYTLDIEKDKIRIISDGLQGAFYGIQTLRQIFEWEEIPCLHIEDKPDFGYRGLYHDMTRGKVAKVETIKKLIDHMAYFKMNSLQLYVEHTFEFEETKELVKTTGCITKEEMKELDEYCSDNFIEFIPSIATFGHMYEILEQEKYKHLRVLKDFEKKPNFWLSRMRHHTIDPLNEESFELVKSLIDQYYPLFKTDIFNICGDETFDLKSFYEGQDVGKIYIDFVQKIIDHLKYKDKKIMMWADILLNHPETLETLPEDMYCLNWNYSREPDEETIKKLSELGKKQIVCPGTSSWSRFCERLDEEEGNITRIIDYGFKHGAVGVLNTNWGDYGNPASIDTAMYGITLGAAKSWAVDTAIDGEFYKTVNHVLYGGEEAMQYLWEINWLHNIAGETWNPFIWKYFELRYGQEPNGEYEITAEEIAYVQRKGTQIIDELSKKTWKYDEARQELILSVEGIIVLAQLGGKMIGINSETVIKPKEWLEKYSEKWLLKNKPSELSKIEEMILYIDEM